MLVLLFLFSIAPVVNAQVPAAEVPDVTYADILKDPDNLELNFRYAKTLINRGDLLAAATVLERILIIRPDEIEIRVIYAVLLFRIGNLDEAQSEFLNIQKAETPEDVARQADQYLERIQEERKQFKLSMTFGIGGQYDTNRTAAPNSGEFLFLDFPLRDLQGTVDDQAVIAFLTVDGSYDLQSQRQHQLLGSVSVYSSTQQEVEDLNVLAVASEVGVLYRHPLVDVTVLATGAVAGVTERPYENPYYYALGGKVRFENSRQKGSKYAFELHLRDEQYFEKISSTKDGLRTVAKLSASTTFSKNHYATASLHVIDKQASARFEEYFGVRINPSFTWFLDSGAYVTANVAFELDDYETPNLFVSVKTRRDKIFSGGLEIGVPLVTLMGTDDYSEALDGIRLVTNAGYYRQDSNIQNFEYDNIRAQVLIVKRWNF